MSHPSRVRGLKFQIMTMLEQMMMDTVAPFTGAWIEIS